MCRKKKRIQSHIDRLKELLSLAKKAEQSPSLNDALKYEPSNMVEDHSSESGKVIEGTHIWFSSHDLVSPESHATKPEEDDNRTKFSIQIPGYSFVNPDLVRSVNNVQSTESFSDLLLKHMTARNIKPGPFCRRSLIDRRLFSKIKGDKMYRPSKRTAEAVCIGLSLDIEDAEKLLAKAGYSLSRDLQEDIVIRYCLENHIYDIDTVNEILDAFDLRCLGF